MSRPAFLLFILLLLFVALAPTPAAAADAGARWASRLPALRLHRRAAPDGAGTARYTPFIRNTYQTAVIDAYEYVHYLSAQCLCEKAKEAISRSGGGGFGNGRAKKSKEQMIEDVFTNNNLARKCGRDATRALAARNPPAVALLAAKLSPNVAFMKTYHARYRHEVEHCICRKNLLRPDDATQPTEEEEDEQRQDCATTVRLQLSSTLVEAPPRLLAPIEQQEQRDRPPSAESLTRLSTPDLAPGGLRRPAMTQRLAGAVAERLRAASDSRAGLWRVLTHDVPAELQRQAADVAPWRGGSNIGAGSGRAVLPMQRLMPLGGR